MSSVTQTRSSLPRITAPQLRDLLQRQNSSPTSTPQVTIVDVRDQDHIGGHIRNSIHYPSSTLHAHCPALVRSQAATPIVVFHCALSQIRGPNAALLYLKERERIIPFTDLATAQNPVEQKVYVLQGGFTEWQSNYGTDETLTENYNKELWEYA